MTKKRLLIGGLVLLVVFIVYSFLFNMSEGTVYSSDNIEFSKTDFVDSMTLSNENKLVASNDNFALYLDETTSHFKVVDLLTLTEWNSNPTVDDPWETDDNENITPSALGKQKATLELSYFNDNGSVARINNYALSISHPESVLFDEGLRSYEVKYLDDGFQILYDIKDIDVDYLYFPKYLTREVLENHPSRFMLELIAYTGFDDDLGVYYIKDDYEGMSTLVLGELYKVFYGEDSLEYTRERAIEENASYGYNEKFEQVSFEVGVEVRLTDSGVTTSVIQDSIVESDKVKLATVSLYPYFGTAISKIENGLTVEGETNYDETEGYIIVPDGSGAVIEFNNGKSYQQPYSKRLYGVDVGIMKHKMPEVQQDIKIPLYGMIKEDSGFAAIITAGDAMATINADVAGRIDSYNKIYTSFNFREKESITLGSGASSYGVTLWTEERVDCDFAVDYSFLRGTEASYVGVANVYKEYLEDNFGFDSVDETTDTIVTTEFLGSYNRKDFAFGVPYSTSESLTTFEQTETILSELKALGVNNINAIYKGMINGGLSSTLNDEFDIESDLGNKRDYNNLLDYMSDNDITLYPEINVMTTSEYNKVFDRFRYTSSRIDGKQSMLFTYHLSIGLPYSETPNSEYNDDYVINPLYFEQITSNFLDDYDQSSIAFSLLGGNLGGSYGDTLVYRQNAMMNQIEVLKNIEENVLLNSPLGYAIPYSDFITDVPFETTRYAILDYQIPLLQLVLSGKVDYSTISLNTDYERSVEYNFLKAIETGSNIKYTLSFDNSKELKDTEYNNYISTEYTNWLTRIDEQVTELDTIGIHNGYLVDHELLEANVIKVTYSHGLQIIINYNLSPITIDGDTIAATNYIVLEVD